MQKIAFIGKGGIGKSTIAANISAIYSGQGSKVLHVGCDPKRDSTLALMGRLIPTFAGNDAYVGDRALARSVHKARAANLFCLEAGGPEPGLGCAGVGVGLMLETLLSSGWLEKEKYDVAVFDILGDVVCGGFAAPLRKGLAEKIVLVVSDEMMSLYSANNLLRMIRNGSGNGARLAGLAANVKDPAGMAVVRRFAETVNAEVLCSLTRHAAVREAELEKRTLIEFAPGSPPARELVKLAARLRGPARSEYFSPMSEEGFLEFSSGGPGAAPVPSALSRRAGSGAFSSSALGEAEELFRSAIVELREIMNNRIRCALSAAGMRWEISIERDGRRAPGPKNWVLFFPGGLPARDSRALDLLKRLSRVLSPLSFEELMSLLLKAPVSLETIGRQFAPGGETNPGPGPGPSESIKDPYLRVGEWARFFFKKHSASASVLALPALVEHGDIECRFHCGAHYLGFFSGDHLSSANSAPTLPVSPLYEKQVLSTDMNARDAVFGAGKKLRAALAAALARDPGQKYIELYNCCTPLLMQEDVKGICASFEKEHGVRVLLEDYNDAYNPNKPRLRADAIAEALRKLGHGKPVYDVNLIGFLGRNRSELAGLLEASGMSCSPESREEEGLVRNMASSRLQVFLGAPDDAACEAFTRRGIKWAFPPGPYGIKRTSSWLRAVAAALGLKKREESFMTRRVRTERAALAAGASLFKAGFVLAAEDLPFLKNPGNTYGVPLVDFLRETGFIVSLLAKAGAVEEKAAFLAALKRGDGSPGPAPEVRFFSSPAELHCLLNGDRALRLVYSDINADERLTSAGKSVFSLRDFEPGYDGALRTAVRLLKRCTRNLYEKYPNRG